jgi:kynureninase
VLLTELTVDIADAWFEGVRVASPRDPQRRGGHVTLCDEDFRATTTRLWDRGVLPDFRAPDGIRVGLSPLSTSFTELYDGMVVLRDLLA